MTGPVDEQAYRDKAAIDDLRFEIELFLEDQPSRAHRASRDALRWALVQLTHDSRAITGELTR